MLEIIGELLNSPDDVNILGCSHYLTNLKCMGGSRGGGGGQGI